MNGAAIIVHGGTFARNANSDIYQEVTRQAAVAGYAVLMASMIN